MKRVLSVILSGGLLFTGVMSFAQPVTQAAAQAPKPIDQKQLMRLGATFQAVRELYVDEVTDEQLIDHAMEGMLADLDPHSAYLDKDELRSLNDMTEGEFSGIGVEVTANKQGVLQVISPLDGSPASKAGVKAGDLIIRVGDQSVTGMQINSVIKAIRGPTGSQVNLTLLRKGEAKPITVTVTREEITLS